MRILAISGSLRAASMNSTLLRAIAALAPAGTVVEFYDGTADLPHFSPDIDTDEVLPPVQSLRVAVTAADAVIVCTPEYAHGVPGSLKNLLDWLVSSGDFDGKPTAVVGASPSDRGGDRAHASLTQTLLVLGAAIPKEASLVVPFVRSKLSADGMITDPKLEIAARAALESLAPAVAK